MSSLTKHQARLKRGGRAMAAAIAVAGELRTGATITTADGVYEVTSVNDGALPGANRHQRRAAAAKGRKR